MAPPLADSTDMPLAVSIELPPPIAMRLSKSPSCRIWTPVPITSVVGSDTVSEKTDQASCAPSSSAVARSRMPQPAIYGSVTIKGRDNPSRAISPGKSANAPPPIAINRGVVISAAIPNLPRFLLDQHNWRRPRPQHFRSVDSRSADERLQLALRLLAAPRSGRNALTAVEPDGYTARALRGDRCAF